MTIRVRFTRAKPFRRRIWAVGAETEVTAAELAEIRSAVEVIAPATPPIGTRDASRIPMRDRLQRLFWKR